ncbi:hypothetical protein Misp01_54160 [Microtetraspora sp. NBRC 13810]|nr:hypothetical protein Misp01_54160 [Microtetraspora sp. NBRC 13810]
MFVPDLGDGRGAGKGHRVGVDAFAAKAVELFPAHTHLLRDILGWGRHIIGHTEKVTEVFNPVSYGRRTSCGVALVDQP